MTAEEWRPVPEFPNYEVSNLGRIASHTRKSRGQLLAPSSDSDGYLRVLLYNDGSRRAFSVHELVLLAFVGPRPDGQEARHLNGVQDQNELSNLAWGSHTENVRDTVRHGTHHNTRKTGCLRGHAFTAENTYSYKGYRCCRTCLREANRAYRTRKAFAAANLQVSA